MVKKHIPAPAEPQYLEPPTPRYNISRILRAKRQIQRECETLVGCELNKTNFSDFISRVQAGLPRGQDIDQDVLVKSVQGLAATRLTKEKLAEMAWRLAGNVAHLQSCTPVPAWGQQPRAEWSPVQVIGAALSWTRKKKLGAVLQLQFLAGSACPLVIDQFWTSGFCGLFSGELGFTVPWRRRPYRDPRQLMGMRFYVKIEPELCTDKPGFHESKVPSGCKNWNKQLLTMRYRLDPSLFVCPGGYHEEHPCHLCSVGADYCEAAVHPETFVQRHCRRCNKDVAWFDPASERKICVDCVHVLKRKGEL